VEKAGTGAQDVAGLAQLAGGGEAEPHLGAQREAGIGEPLAAQGAGQGQVDPGVGEAGAVPGRDEIEEEARADVDRDGPGLLELDQRAHAQVEGGGLVASFDGVVADAERGLDAELPHVDADVDVGRCRDREPHVGRGQVEGGQGDADADAGRGAGRRLLLGEGRGRGREGDEQCGEAGEGADHETSDGGDGRRAGARRRWKLTPASPRRPRFDGFGGRGNPPRRRSPCPAQSSRWCG
jgi:hypothetical protein